MFFNLKSFTLALLAIIALTLLSPLPILATDVVQTGGGEDGSDEWEIDLPTHPVPEEPGPDVGSEGPYRLEISPEG